MHGRRVITALFVFALVLCAQAAPAPRYDHIVIVIEENHDASAVLGSPYIAALASQGMSLTRMYGITHPSQPNYIALFSGSQQGVVDNNRHDIAAPNLATALAAEGLTFACYSEDLPSAGWTGWSSGRYVRRHNPAASFTNVPAAVNLPFASFPSDYTRLPTVAFIVPNLDHDMHDGSVAAGDAWLQANLGGYAQWAAAHNSLFIVTFDECSGSKPVATTPIATVIVGAGVPRGPYDKPANLYSLLRLVLSATGLGPLGEEAAAPSITGIGG